MSSVFLNLLLQMKPSVSDDDVVFLKLLLIAIFGAEHIITNALNLDNDAIALIKCMQTVDIRILPD